MRSWCVRSAPFAVLFLLAMAFPSSALAQNASCDLPNSSPQGCGAFPGTCAGDTCSTPPFGISARRLAIIIKFEKPNKTPGQVVVTAPKTLENQCETGEIITGRAAFDICDGMANNNITKIAPVGSTMTVSKVGGPACSATPANGDTYVFNETTLQAGQACAFNLTYSTGAPPNFSVAPNGGCKTTGVQFASTGGNAFAADLLDRYLVQVNPLGHNGVVTFTVRDLADVDHSFTVNTASFADQASLHGAIQAGYQSLGLGLNVTCCTGPTACSQIPDTTGGSSTGGFEQGPVILVSNASQRAKLFTVRGVTDQKIVQETSAPLAGTGIPTLSQWGAALLVGLLLLSSLWFLRRRQSVTQI